MPRVRTASSQLFALLFLVTGFAAGAQQPSATPTPLESSFRTPARQYGSAYSIKIKLVRGDFDWVVPVWVKPDQKTSTFDQSLMNLMGWTEPRFEFDEVSLSGVVVDHNKFGQAKSDWAYFPDFAKSCCIGILGQDILRHYEVRFDPRPPAHLEWKRLAPDVESKNAGARIAADLKGIFSLTSISYKKRDLTAIPYRLNLAQGKLEFEDEVKAPQARRATPLFRYDIAPPVRNIEILSVAGDVAKSAAKAGLKPGATITSLDGSPIGKLDKVELDQVLIGKRQERLTFTLKTKKEITFDFKKNEFTSPEPVPGRPR